VCFYYSSSQLKVPKKNPLQAERPLVVYAAAEGDGFCAIEFDEEDGVGAVFTAGASLATIKEAVANVAGERRKKVNHTAAITVTQTSQWQMCKIIQ
jgi:hypothetical protein